MVGLTLDFKISVVARRLAERRGEEVEKRERKPLGKKPGREGLGMYKEKRKKKGRRERELRSGWVGGGNVRKCQRGQKGGGNCKGKE